MSGWTIPLVRSWRPAALTSAADDLGRASSAVDDQVDELDDSQRETARRTAYRSLLARGVLDPPTPEAIARTAAVRDDTDPPALTVFSGPDGCWVVDAADEPLRAELEVLRG
ncbi:hypothetical protein BKA08_000950 [Nocardioides marinisabuli]|uniref:Uncharacterized protein n=1 Tax=Nocardioides marinisabuli TaxID=419476 RepID=A0A7Y9EZ89_9ACTN|nr:hypothetical protein [Nocardioides marinisabuli]NYD56712.1 hypothetical protein [Nocardioides marinisabuli]